MTTDALRGVTMSPDGSHWSARAMQACDQCDKTVIGVRWRPLCNQYRRNRLRAWLIAAVN